MSERGDADGASSVAIACQGGGSHTAFTAGVLERVLPIFDGSSYELVGLSGTSGGAVCATAAWYGLHVRGTEYAAATLESVWRDFAAKSPFERVANAWFVALAKFAARGGPIPLFSPYELPYTKFGRDQFLDTLETHVEFDRIPDLAADASADLILGTADVTEGEFETFVNEEVTAETVLASAAIPTLFEAVGIDDHWYWDGLFSQNPPIRDFLTMPETASEKPDEIWIVQINPKHREEVPESVEDIADRRNELSANLSLFQEVYFIEKMNDLIERGSLPQQYKPVEVEFVDLGSDLPAPTKIDRDPEFVDRLLQRGQRRAERFLRSRR